MGGSRVLVDNIILASIAAVSQQLIAGAICIYYFLESYCNISTVTNENLNILCAKSKALQKSYFFIFFSRDGSVIWFVSPPLSD